MNCGGLDIGGTKIEARLFDDSMALIESRRIATPASDTGAFLDAVAQQIGWLMAASGGTGLPVGIAMAGIVNRATGASTAANLPIDGVDVGAALARRFGRKFVFCNDCDAFACSEANGGAAPQSGTMVGLVIGTGLGAGLCIDGALAPRATGVPVEIGHIGLAARALAVHGLPLWRCGCGRIGCAEAYVAGPGLERLARWHLGVPVSATALPVHPRGHEVLAIWAALMAEVLDTLRLLLDPGCIVLGGGLSNLPDVAQRLTAAMAATALAGLPPPAIVIAAHGDSSGARGVALLARDAAREARHA